MDAARPSRPERGAGPIRLWRTGAKTDGFDVEPVRNRTSLSEKGCETGGGRAETG